MWLYRIKVMDYAGKKELFYYNSSVVPRNDDILQFKGTELKVSRVKFCIEEYERLADCREAVLYTVQLT